MESYNIKELAMMTDLTTRTLRNYLRSGLLNGDKIDGMWQFTAENISDFISNPIVKPSIQAKNKAIVFDFLADDHKKEDSICTILDLHVSAAEADKISAFSIDLLSSSCYCYDVNSFFCFYTILFIICEFLYE